MDEFTKCLPIQSAGPSSLYYNLQSQKANFYFSFTEEVFFAKKNHPPDLSLAGDCIGRVEGYLMMACLFFV